MGVQQSNRYMVYNTHTHWNKIEPPHTDVKCTKILINDLYEYEFILHKFSPRNKLLDAYITQIYTHNPSCMFVNVCRWVPNFIVPYIIKYKINNNMTKKY